MHDDLQHELEGESPARIMRDVVRTLLVTSFMLAAFGCAKRSLRYDDVDIAGLQAAFDCGKSPTGDRAEACRMIGDFENGAPFEAFPSKGLETWRGRKVCTDSIDANDRFELPAVYLHPGIGKPLFPTDVKTEPARDIAHGALFIPGIASFKNPAVKPGYQELVAAAREGRSPVFTMIPLEERNFLQLAWDSGQKPPNAGSDFYRLVRSKGKSILEAPMTDGNGPSAQYFIRAHGPRMLVAQPAGRGAPACVMELWKTYSDPSL